MRHLSTDDVARRLAREVACVKCYQRPPGSETLGPEVARWCELSCPLFVQLPLLVSVARDVGDRAGECESKVRASVCGACRLRATSGEFCAGFSTRECALSRYSDDVVAGLQRVLRSHLDPGPAGGSVA